MAYPEYGKKFCRKFLKILFGREFKNLNIVTQKSYGGRDTGLHGARLDVYIEEGDEVEIDSSNVSAIYDIEPDKNNKRKDPRPSCAASSMPRCTRLVEKDSFTEQSIFSIRV